MCVKDIHKSRCVTLPSSLHLDIPALVIPAHCFVFFTITQNTGLFHRTGLPSPWPGRGLRCLLTFFTINPEHWSFSPNWTSFTLPWGWTLDDIFTTSQSTGLFHQLVLLHPVLGNGLLAAFLHHIPDHWSYSPVGLASPCSG